MIRAGISLIELLIAISMISVVMVALATAASRSVSLQMSSSSQVRATKLAEEQMERVRALRDRSGFDAISCVTKCAIATSAEPFAIGPTVSVEVFTVWFEVKTPGLCPTQPAGLTAMKEITTRAQWTDSRGTHQAKKVECLSEWRNQ
jgi:Tfp pilus assembly protein PilV